MKDDYNGLNKLFKNKKICYIPIYSCFDYKTERLNFKADGNINRFLTVFNNVNKYKSIDIFCPIDGNNIDWFESSIDKIFHNYNLIKTDLIRKSAKIERSQEFAREIKKIVNFSVYDFIIVEGQHVYLELEDKGYYDKLVYWCPVCATLDKTRDFLEPFKELDKYLLSHSKYVILASKDQVKYIKTLNHHKVYQLETLIDPTLDIFSYNINQSIIDKISSYKCKIVYLPFRLTDKGYKTKEILDILYSNFKDGNHIRIIYSNPNECDIYQFTNDSYMKLWLSNNSEQVSKDRDTYYTIINHCEVIIPYLEDTDFINHAAIYEFKKGKCILCKSIKSFKSML